MYRLILIGFSCLSTNKFFYFRQVSQATIMNVQFLVSLVITLGFVAGLEAVCCKRRPDFLCCGNGKCNIFCCNCDGGCNAQCEVTHCDTTEWLECAAVVAACAGVCSFAEIDEPACIECLGALYDTCKKCYSPVDKRRAMNDTMFMLNAYHKEISHHNMVSTMAEFSQRVNLTKEEKKKDEL